MSWKVLSAAFFMIVVSASACASSQNSAAAPQGAGAAPSPSSAQQSARDEVESEERDDRLEPFNQAMFTFNRKADDWVLRPVATGWAKVMPKPARASVGRFFNNVGVIPRFANDVFQLQFKQGGTEVARFGINSTLGVAGLFDPADKWFGLEQEDNDFGLTLAKYGVREGPYLVLPLLGPSTVRDAAGGVADGAMNPVNYTAGGGAELYEAGAKAFAAINTRSENLDKFDEVERDTIDPYAAVQDAYLQHRLHQENKVRFGE